MTRWILALAVIGALLLVLRYQGGAGSRTPMTWDARAVAALTADLADAAGEPAPADALTGAKRVLVYFSASRCPPCRAFTPEFVEYYRTHGGGWRFTVLFVSRDESAGAMRSYMRDEAMPWWGVRFGSHSADALGAVYAGRGIPCLMLLDGHGKVLADSFVDGAYVGPHAVLKALGDGI